MPTFKKKERVRKHTDFISIYKCGKRANSRCFMFNWVKGNTRRLGLTVSSRVGNACTRNRIKRIVRELFRLNKDIFPMADCVVTAKLGAAQLSNKEISTELLELLIKVNKK